jgi:hypothetical protein
MDREVICKKCGGNRFKANQYYDDVEDFIVELICTNCAVVEYFRMIINCHECDDTPDEWEETDFQLGYDQAYKDMEDNGRDIHEEKQNR